MSATYSTFLNRNLHGLNQDELLATLKQFVLDGCCLSFCELLADGQMATFQFKYNRTTRTEEALCTFSEPTTDLLEVDIRGSAPYSLFARCLEDVFIVVPDSFAEAECELPFFDTQLDSIRLHTYEIILPRMASELSTLRDLSHATWQHIDADPQQYLAFNEQLLQQMQLCERAQVIFAFNW